MKRSCGRSGLSASAASGQAPTQLRHSVHLSVSTTQRCRTARRRPAARSSRRRRGACASRWSIASSSVARLSAWALKVAARADAAAPAARAARRRAPPGRVRRAPRSAAGARRRSRGRSARACATAICSASALRYCGASSPVSSTQTWLAPCAIAASHRSMPTLAVCHTRHRQHARRHAVQRAVGARGAAELVDQRGAGAVAVDQQRRRRARRRRRRRAASCAAAAPGRPCPGRRNVIAPLGHTVLQAPQPTHRCGSTTMPPVDLRRRRPPCARLPAACPCARRRCGSPAPSRRRCRRVQPICSLRLCAQIFWLVAEELAASRTRRTARAARARPRASGAASRPAVEVALRRLVHRERRRRRAGRARGRRCSASTCGSRSKSIAPAASQTRTQSRWLVAGARGRSGS